MEMYLIVPKVVSNCLHTQTSSNILTLKQLSVKEQLYIRFVIEVVCLCFQIQWTTSSFQSVKMPVSMHLHSRCDRGFSLHQVWNFGPSSSFLMVIDGSCLILCFPSLEKVLKSPMISKNTPLPYGRKALGTVNHQQISTPVVTVQEKKLVKPQV